MKRGDVTWKSFVESMPRITVAEANAEVAAMIAERHERDMREYESLGNGGRKRPILPGC